MLSREKLAAHVRRLERELRKAKEREELLVEMVRRGQEEHERQIVLMAIARVTYEYN